MSDNYRVSSHEMAAGKWKAHVIAWRFKFLPWQTAMSAATVTARSVKDSTGNKISK